MINCGGYPVTHRCPSTIRIVSSWGFVWLSWCGRLYFLPLPWPQRTPQHLIWSPARDVLGDWTCLRASPGLAEPHCLYLHRLYPPQELPSLPVSCLLYSPSSPSLCVFWADSPFCLLFPPVAPCFPPILLPPQTLYRMTSSHRSTSRNSSGDQPSYSSLSAGCVFLYLVCLGGQRWHQLLQR